MSAEEAVEEAAAIKLKVAVTQARGGTHPLPGRAAVPVVVLPMEK
jgi:hypothetical protein